MSFSFKREKYGSSLLISCCLIRIVPGFTLFFSLYKKPFACKIFKYDIHFLYIRTLINFVYKFGSGCFSFLPSTKSSLCFLFPFASRGISVDVDYEAPSRSASAALLVASTASSVKMSFHVPLTSFLGEMSLQWLSIISTAFWANKFGLFTSFFYI